MSDCVTTHLTHHLFFLVTRLSYIGPVRFYGCITCTRIGAPGSGHVTIPEGMAVKLWQRLGALMDPAASDSSKQFSLGNRGRQPNSERQGTERILREVKGETAAIGRRIEHLLAAQEQAREQERPKPLEEVSDLSAKLDENLERIRTLFRAPANKDLVIRELQIATQPPLKAAIVFLEGMAKNETINNNILGPLMLYAHLDHHLQPAPPQLPALRDPLRVVTERLLPTNQAAAKYLMHEITSAILYGDTAILIDGCNAAVVCETKGFPLRSVSEPKQEQAVRGAHDAFNESFRINVALVRKRLKDPRLVTEIIEAGEVTRTYVGITYLDGIAAPKLVEEVKRRVGGLKLDYVGEAGILEQMIEDRPYSLFPQALVTERPDRVAGYLSEGTVAIFADNSPAALVVPVTWWALMQTSEDYHLRWPIGIFLRWLRLAAIAIALTAGAIYIAAVNYHHEMIPTELMLSIAASREQVPFPAALELLTMEFAFELVKEAGTRIPSIIGPTIGIVGGLILGQAAVQAKLFSPIVVIITAIAGLAASAVPNYATAFSLRILRFIFIAFAMVLGLYGLAAVAFGLMVYLSGLRSFGVPYLSPLAPRRPPIPDAVNRPGIMNMEMRPAHLRPVDQRRQQDPSRVWDQPAGAKKKDQPEPPDGRGG